MSLGEAYQGAFFGASEPDPFVRWFDEELVIDRNATELCMDVWRNLECWCHKTGNLALLATIPEASKLIRRLQFDIPGLWNLSTYRKWGDKGKRFVGIRLKHRNSVR